MNSEAVYVDKPSLKGLPQVSDRMTFLYLEHCKINRIDNAISIKDESGTVNVPSAMISVLLLGPGTDITHRAIELAGDTGVGICWVGEQGVKFYAHGKALSSNTKLLQKQAELVSNKKMRLSIVKKMYQIRFPTDDTSNMTLQQLRGREGSRMRKVYKIASKEWGVPWDGRSYDHDSGSAADDVNASLSVANSCLYGLTCAVVHSLGCSPGLGFIHTGHELSFVYDIADLYKAEISIPAAFKIASQSSTDIEGDTRREVRDLMTKSHLLERMVKDIRYLLQDETVEMDDAALYLWDDIKGTVANATQYKEESK